MHNIGGCIFIRASYAKDWNHPTRLIQRSASVCTRLREVCSCSCLPVLPGPAWVLLSKICLLFSYESDKGCYKRTQETYKGKGRKIRQCSHCFHLQLLSRKVRVPLSKFVSVINNCGLKGMSTLSMSPLNSFSQPSSLISQAATHLAMAVLNDRPAWIQPMYIAHWQGRLSWTRSWILGCLNPSGI